MIKERESMNCAMKLLVSVAILLCSVQSFAQSSSSPGAKNYADWPSGAIRAINVNERKLRVNGQIYRVALKATIESDNGKKMDLAELRPKFIISYREEGATGDLVDIVVVAAP